MSNHNNAGRDIIQSGRDYIKTIQVNFASGNIVTAIISTLPVIMAVFIVGSTVKWTLETTGIIVPSFSGSATLSQGDTTIIGDSVLLQASTDKPPGVFISVKIPFSAYKQSSIKLGSEFNGEGTVIIFSNSGKKEYSLNAEDSNLTLQLDEAPRQKGKFIRGSLYGTATDGIEKRSLNLKMVVPF